MHNLNNSYDVDVDEYREVINGDKTYNTIANSISEFSSAIIGWTDQAGTHLDILFCYMPGYISPAQLQRGIKHNDLFVSVMATGAFGFKLSSKDLAPGYIAEKLGIQNFGVDLIDAFAELINNVKSKLYDLESAATDDDEDTW